VDHQSPLLRQIGKRLRAARELAGLSQSDVAYRVCMNRSSIANLEAGRQDTTVTRLALIAQVVGLPLADLVRDGVSQDVPKCSPQAPIAIAADRAVGALLLAHKTRPVTFRFGPPVIGSA
jgi:transcriptional regulator with XRE-family HTH domain